MSCNVCSLAGLLLFTLVAVPADAQHSVFAQVRCDNGQSIKAGVDNTREDGTAEVSGTCSERVLVARGTFTRGGEQAPATPASPGAPKPPSGLAAMAGDNRVELSWTGSSAAASYTVKRATSSGDYTTTFPGITTTSYADATALNSTTYYYVVTALNTGGESGPSNEASATAAAPSVEVTVSAIAPSPVSQHANIVYILVTGTGFATGASIAFENGDGPAPLVNSVTFIDPERLWANIKLRPGGPPRNRNWDVRVTNPDGSTGVGLALLEIET